MKKVIVLACIALMGLQSCNFDTPENYFDHTTLNTNKLRDFGSIQIERMIAQNEGGMLFTITNEELTKTNSLQEHITNYLLPDIEKDIQKVKKLKPTKDTEDMIEASLAVYNFTKEKYETDYMEVAKLVDAKSPQNEIDAALLQLDDENLDTLSSLYEKLMTVAFAYAKENGI